jgi:hypothetical protein
MYKELLCCHSKHFQADFEGHFRESEEKTIRLQHVDIRVFRIFCHWLYAQLFRTEVSDRVTKTEQPDGATRTAKSDRATNDPRYDAANLKRPSQLTNCNCGAVDRSFRRAMINGRAVIEILIPSDHSRTCLSLAHKATRLEADPESNNSRRKY